jgi:hypothetical protein
MAISPPEQPVGDAATKRLATIARNKAANRADKIAEINRQVDEGSLVIRQMTAAERRAVS